MLDSKNLRNRSLNNPTSARGFCRILYFLYNFMSTTIGEKIKNIKSYSGEKRENRKEEISCTKW